MKRILTIGVMSLGLATAAEAATLTQTKLTATDRAPSDFFGGSVAISGSTAIVGASGDDDAGAFSGSAYLFDTSTGVQGAKLTASDAAAGDGFGGSVAISGGRALVGASGDDDGGTSSGSAYLFDTTTGAQVAKLTADDGSASDRFGISVGMSGNTAIVGSYRDEHNGINSGSAYIFDATTGAQLHKLTAGDADSGDDFGVSVAISGSAAIVGARADDDKGASSGSAYLFDATTGDQIAKLTADDGAAYDSFGSSVAISGSTAIVGAQGDDDNGNLSGSVYVFDITSGDLLAKHTASGGFGTGDQFGLSAAISGNTFLVGALGDDGSRGAAYAFSEPPSAVPLPGGVWLLGSALGLVLLLRRRG